MMRRHLWSLAVADSSTNLVKVCAVNDEKAFVVIGGVLKLAAALGAFHQLPVLHNPDGLVHLHVALPVCSAQQYHQVGDLKMQACYCSAGLQYTASSSKQNCDIDMHGLCICMFCCFALLICCAQQGHTDDMTSTLPGLFICMLLCLSADHSSTIRLGLDDASMFYCTLFSWVPVHNRLM